MPELKTRDYSPESYERASRRGATGERGGGDYKRGTVPASSLGSGISQIDELGGEAKSQTTSASAKESQRQKRLLSKPPKQSGAEIQERPDKRTRQNRELWQESVANSSLELSEILDSLLSVIRKDDEQIQFLEKNGAGRKELVSCIVDLLTCNTVDREGNPIPDNMARAKGQSFFPPSIR